MLTKKKFQVTLFSEKYKPVSCIVYAENRQEIMRKGEAYKEALRTICGKRSWTVRDLKEYGYTKLKAREVE